MYLPDGISIWIFATIKYVFSYLTHELLKSNVNSLLFGFDFERNSQYDYGPRYVVDLM